MLAEGTVGAKETVGVRLLEMCRGLPIFARQRPGGRVDTPGAQLSVS